MKRFKPSLFQSILILVALLLSFQLYLVIQRGVMTRQSENQRLQHLDKENLDLPFIINYVDDLGGDTIQYHWKEMTAILAMEKANYTTNLTATDYDQMAKRFSIDKSQHLRSFEEVLAQKDYSEKELTRARTYLNELQYFGYTPHKLTPESKEGSFIHQIKEAAIENYQTTNILPSITIAQAILESNWGESELAIQANNLFGVKVGYHWTGQRITFKTREFYDTFIEDDFRSYPNAGDSITDHAQFLVENPRYTEAGVFEAQTYRTQAKALELAGYSTAQDEEGNPTYAKMLGELIRQYDLQLIDHDVKHPEN